MKKIIFILLAFPLCSFSQEKNQKVQGRVWELKDNGKEFPLPFASVSWLGTKVGTVADSAGHFSLLIPKDVKILITSFAGYNTDTTVVEDFGKPLRIILYSGVTLPEAIIIHKRRTSEIIKLQPKLTINISQGELQKAACCNLSESFETSPAVDVSFTDALTGTRQIKMLGLDGIYTQLTKELMPGIRGMSSPYGMQFIPGSWIEGIQLTKGVGSVLHGFESMAGQINIELKKPTKAEKWMLDGFASQNARTEINAGRMFQIKPNLHSGILAHYSIRPFYTDMNNDGFLDNPLSNQVNLINRWDYFTKKGFEGQFGFQLMNDQKKGGQSAFIEEGYLADHYGLEIANRSFEIWAKNGYVFRDKPYQSFGSQISFINHDLQSTYGNPNAYIPQLTWPPNPLWLPSLTDYSGNQKSFYVNLLFQSIIGTTQHKYTTGLSFQMDVFDEKLKRFGTEENFKRTEWVPGVFIEYTLTASEKLTIVSGLRADYNNLFGAYLTPRIHSRYLFNKEKTVLRLSGGRGQRTANILAENQRILATNRWIIIDESNSKSAYGLNPEVSWNYGLSLSHDFKINYRAASIHTDVFRTDFQEQVVIDYDYSSRAVRFYNLDGRSFANSAQITLESEPIKKLDVRMAYRYYDVKTNQLGGLLNKALLSPHRAFINAAYTTKKKWSFDLTAQWYDASRLPSTTGSPENFQRPVNSPSFVLLHGQISKFIKKEFQLYLGVENINNLIQNNPIVSAENPFNQYFDSSMVWGPIFGRMIYGGFRWRIEREKVKG